MKHDRSSWLYWGAIVSLVGLGALTACRDLFVTTADDRGMVVDNQTLHSTNVLQLEKAVEDGAASDDAERFIRDELPDDSTAADRLEISIEQCRAWTLENNLELRVAMIDPRIASTTVDEEEARFEAVFLANIGGADADPGQAGVFRDQFVRPFTVEPGVEIPLRSGGTIGVSLPLTREEDFGFSNDSLYVSDLDFSISHPLLRDAGRRANTHRIRIAALDTQISQARTKLEVIRQIANADRAYWLLYEADKRLVIREEQYHQALDQLKQAEARFRGQVSPEIEVTRAQAGVSRRRASIIISRLLVRDRQRLLKRIINVPGVDVDSPRMLELTSEPESLRYALWPEALVDAALQERMELLELELQLARDMSEIEFAKNKTLPLFTLDYTYRVQGIGGSFGRGLEGVAGVDEWGWRIGLAVEVPIGNEAAQARLQRALFMRLQRLSSRSAREQVIKQEVLAALDNLEATWQRIVVAMENVRLEIKNYLGEKGQYKVGLRNSTEVLEAEMLLAEAKIREIAAIVDYQIAQVDLAFATGMLLGASRVTW